MINTEMLCNDLHLGKVEKSLKTWTTCNTGITSILVLTAGIPGMPVSTCINNEEGRCRTGQPPIASVIAKIRLCLFGHLARADPSQEHSHILQAAINRPLVDWRCQAGRPRRTWLRTIELDLQPHNLGLQAGSFKIASDVMLTHGHATWW